MIELLWELNFDRSIPILLSLIPGLLSLSIFIYALIRLPKSGITATFALFVFSTFIWQLSDTLIRASEQYFVAKLWQDLLFAGVLFIGPFSLHFTLLYTERKKITRSYFLIFILYFPAFFFEVAEGGNLFRHAIVFDSFWGWVSAPTFEFLNTLEASWIASCGLITLLLLGNYAYKMKDVEVRNKQSLLIFIGYVIPASQGILTQYLLPFFFDASDNPLTTTTTVVFSTCVVIALAKYRLLSYNPLLTSDNLIRTMNEGILVTDHVGVTKYVNERFCKIIGYSQGELIDQKAEDVFVPVKEIDKLNEGRAKRGEGESSEYEMELINKNDETIQTWISATPYFNPDGHNIGSLVIVTDITKRKRAQLAREIAFNITKSANRGIRDINSLGRLIYSEIIQLIPKANFYISLVNEETNIVHFPFWIHEGIDYSGTVEREFSNGFSEFIITTGQSVYLKGREVNDFVDRNELGHVEVVPAIYLATPLKHLGKVIGVLALQSDYNQNEYDENDFEFLKFISGQVASFIDKQEMLEEQQQREADLLFFRNIIDQSNDFISVVDIDNGNIVDVNERTCQKLGYSKEEMTNMLYTEIHIVEEDYIWNDYLMKLRSGNQVIESCFYRSKDGIDTPVEMNMSIVTIDLVEYLVAVGRDVKEQEDARSALERSEKQLSHLVENLDVSVYAVEIISEDPLVEKLLYQSKQIEKFAGFKIGNFSDIAAWDQHVHPEDIDQLVADVQHMLKTHESMTSEYRFYHRETKKIIWVEENYRPVKIVDGKVKTYYGAIRDVTERKNNEKKLASAHKELEAFIYKASHDLKGPLSSSLGLVNIARLESGEENESKYFDHIEGSLKKLENILDDLRQVAIIKQGVIEKSEINIINSIEDIISTFKFYNEFESIDFKFDNSIGDTIFTDRSLLELCLRNTIENAVKYQKYNFKESFVHFNLSNTPTGIKIIIKDNGIGIDADHIHTIFDMFVRANQTSKGTGLGLYISKNAIEKLGGTISVESKKGWGTTFEINLPISIAEEDTPS
ncbi:MAG: PAS domain S-box protein [Flavobacteriales bacterium]|nr:PAS domain S-box protein [Flavobacteriales bacterium]